MMDARASEARVAIFTCHSSVYIAIKMAECAYVTLHDTSASLMRYADGNKFDLSAGLFEKCCWK